MKKLISSILLSITFVTAGIAQEAKKPTVWNVELKPNMIATTTGSLSEDGVALSDYSWAWNSQNACFPATQKSKFTGNHVFYSVQLPPRSVLNITVEPDKKGTNLSIYGYQIAADKIILPEDLNGCVACEADHKWDYPKRGKTQGDERKITFNSTTNSYNVIVGVAGANGLTEGSFKLHFELKQ